MSKLNLDRDIIESCRLTAQKIIHPIHEMVVRHSTLSIERATLRFLGIHDTLEGMPLVNLIVDQLPPQFLSKGIAYWLGRAMLLNHASPIGVALKMAQRKIDLKKMAPVPLPAIREALHGPVRNSLRRLEQKGQRRQQLLEKHFRSFASLKLVSISQDDIGKDSKGIHKKLKNDVSYLEVERKSGSELLEYVLNGHHTRDIRRHLDQWGQKNNLYIRLLEDATGLCLPEETMIGAENGVDALYDDALHGIVMRDIDMQRAIVDQHFSRLIMARAQMIVHTREDCLLKLTDCYRNFYQTIALQFLQEQWCRKARIEDDHLVLSFSFAIDSAVEDGLLYEMAQAQMVREIFPKAFIQCGLPIRMQSENSSSSSILNGISSLVAVLTEFNIIKLDSEDSPIVDYLLQGGRSLGTEVQWQQNGKVIRRARAILDNAQKLLKTIERTGLTQCLSQGVFANLSRDPEGGLGAQGVFRRDKDYFNPLWEELER